LQHLHILQAISPTLVKLLTDGAVTYTDILVWAILVDRFELAKAVSQLFKKNNKNKNKKNRK
jgi:hypothetical protein